ncbi:hypothetical protein MSS2_01487 [Mycobacterium marinum]|nr:hypothetical protein MSS2_01487 [Mycobacterium marinum]
MRGGHRGRLRVGQTRRDRGSQRAITGDKSGPTTMRGHPTDSITNLMIGDIGTHRGHHTGEIGTQLRHLPIGGVIPTETDQHIREVDTGGADRDLDLTRPRRDPIKSHKLHRLQIPRRADLQPHPLSVMLHHRGLALFGTQRHRRQPRRIPLATTPRRLVFLRARQQLTRNHLRTTVLININMSGMQMRILSTNHPQQTTQPSLLQIGTLTTQHRLRTPRHHKQPRRLTHNLGQLPNNTHHMPNTQHRLRTPRHHKQPRRLTHNLGQLPNNTHHMPNVIAGHGAAAARPGHDDHAREPVVAQLIAEPLSVGDVVGLQVPARRDAVGAKRLQRLGEPRRESIGGF